MKTTSLRDFKRSLLQRLESHGFRRVDLARAAKMAPNQLTRFFNTDADTRQSTLDRIRAGAWKLGI